MHRTITWSEHANHESPYCVWFLITSFGNLMRVFARGRKNFGQLCVLTDRLSTAYRCISHQATAAATQSEHLNPNRVRRCARVFQRTVGSKERAIGSLTALHVIEPSHLPYHLCKFQKHYHCCESHSWRGNEQGEVRVSKTS